jgi:hypothetical protein
MERTGYGTSLAKPAYGVLGNTTGLSGSQKKLLMANSVSTTHT